MTHATSLAACITALGHVGFGAAMMAALAQIADADMCSAFGLEDEPELILAESREAAHAGFARIASLRYARRHWNRDTPTLANLGRAHRDVLVTRRAGHTIRDLDYRLECYGDGAVNERLSILAADPPVRFVLNAYRLGGRPSFSAEAIAQFSDAAPLLMAALQRHHGLLRSPPPEAGSVVERLRALAPGLSLREGQVLHGLAAGRTVPEVAAMLALSASTVTTYRKRGYAKLGLTGRRALQAMLAEEG